MPKIVCTSSGGFTSFLSRKVRQVVEVPDVVALELEARAAVFAEVLQRVLDVLERVAEDEVAARLEVLRLPVVFPLGALVEIGVQPEIHRAHVERADFGLGDERRRKPLLHRHIVAAAGGDIDYCIGGRLDLRQELHEDLRIGRWPSVDRIACVQMQDRRTRFGRADRTGCDLVRRDRKIWRHGRGMYRPRHGAGNDDFAGFGHDSPS
jgi:hypothetical protein